MKPGTPSAHAEALRAAVIEAAKGFAVYLDEVPKDPPYPYIVIWSDPALSRDESLGDVAERSTFHPAWTVAARSPATARTVRDLLDDVLAPDAVKVPGRLLELERLSTTTISRDNDLEIPVYWYRDTLELRSYAA